MFRSRFRTRLLTPGAIALLAIVVVGAAVMVAASVAIALRPPASVALRETKPNAGARSRHPSHARHATLPLKNDRPRPPSAFDLEQQLSFTQLMSRWNPLIMTAGKRFRVPPVWIRVVMQIESGGRTMLGPNQSVVSNKGALGLMQLMPQTYDDMRKQFGLGRDPFDPHDNVFAGAAYLAWLRGKYGYPQLFAAYNDGPGHLDQRLAAAQLLPDETRNYLGTITATLNGQRGHGAALARLTRPNGTAVMVDASAVSAVRAPFDGEYAPGVQAVVTTGKLRQGVTESVARAKAVLRAHGGAV